MNKQENIYSLKGFDKVFRFTVRQTFKNKAYVTSFVMFVLVMTFMGPIQFASFKAGSSVAGDVINYSPQSIDIDTLYVLNETDVPFGMDDLDGLYADETADGATGLQKSKVVFADSSKDEITGKLDEDDAALIVGFSETGYAVNIVTADETKITVSDLDEVSSFAAGKFDAARLSSSGISDADMATLQHGISFQGTYTEDEFAKEDQKTVSQMSYFNYLLGFSIVLMIVMVMSSSYIITSVNEEKQSKLVESILVSVRPMALLMGKITGMMTYVVLVLVCGMTGSLISNAVLENVFDSKAQGFDNSGFSLSIFTDNGIGASLILIFAIVLGFLTFGILAGLFGSACNQAEDVQSATSSVMLVCMVGYFAAIGAGTSDSSVFNLVASIVPPLSFYVAPVAYITGRIPIYILLIAFALQIALVVILAVVSAKTYRNLLLKSTGKPKLGTILKAIGE